MTHHRALATRTTASTNHGRIRKSRWADEHTTVTERVLFDLNFIQVTLNAILEAAFIQGDTLNDILDRVRQIEHNQDSQRTGW